MMQSESLPFNDKRYSLSSQERGPLRRRENDAFVSSVSEMPPPFTHPQRRKREDKIVQYAMKAVLLSPVAVLALWTIATVVFTSKHIKSAPARRANRIPLKAKHRRNPSETFLDAVEVAGQAFGSTQNTNLMMQPQLQQIQMQMMNPAAAMQSPGVVRPGPGPMPRLPVDLPQAASSNLIVQPGVLMNSQPQMMQSQQMMNAQPIMRAEPKAAQPLMIQAQSMQPQPQPQEAQTPLSLLPAGAAQPHLRNGKARVYYYDPRQSIASQGQLFLPPIVYDDKGNPHELSRLQAKEILVEPPMGEPQNETKLLDSPAKGASFSQVVDEGVQWTESSSTNQSIIVCTVGVMALLVGAVSARKLRSRSILSVCIENESIEDEVAYDAAYTVASDTYNTFAHWKNDLEKFDV